MVRYLIVGVVGISVWMAAGMGGASARVCERIDCSAAMITGLGTQFLSGPKALIWQFASKDTILGHQVSQVLSGNIDAVADFHDINTCQKLDCSSAILGEFPSMFIAQPLMTIWPHSDGKNPFLVYKVNDRIDIVTPHCPAPCPLPPTPPCPPWIKEVASVSQVLCARPFQESGFRYYATDAETLESFRCKVDPEACLLRRQIDITPGALGVSAPEPGTCDPELPFPDGCTPPDRGMDGLLEHLTFIPHQCPFPKCVPEDAMAAFADVALDSKLPIIATSSGFDHTEGWFGIPFDIWETANLDGIENRVKSFAAANASVWPEDSPPRCDTIPPCSKGPCPLIPCIP